MIEYLEEEKLTERIKEGKVIVNFFGTWCGPCKMMAPVLEKIANEKKIKVIKIDIDNHPLLTREYGVMSVPTFLFFKDGEQINRQVGFMTKDALENYFK
ncbi:MAG: thioredoxin [Bacilli bacterium]